MPGIPERMRFTPDLQWAITSHGIKSVHAFNVIERVQNNNQIGINILDFFSCAPDSWDAYKQVKTVFRLVVEVEGYDEDTREFGLVSLAPTTTANQPAVPLGDPRSVRSRRTKRRMKV